MTRKSLFLLILILFFLIPVNVFSQTLPGLRVELGTADNPQELSLTIQIILFLTILTLAPAILVLMTSFTRIVIVLSLLRHALSLQQIPPNQVIIGLSLFLTFFVMSPVFNDIYTNAYQPYQKKEITQKQAFEKAMIPLRGFMMKQTREKDIALFMNAAKLPRPANQNDVPTKVLIPAYVISELRIAFEMGFMLFIPFLIIDMVVSSVLMSMGMLMLPPIMVSLPFKILLFVLVDGWYLLIQSLILSFS